MKKFVLFFAFILAFVSCTNNIDNYSDDNTVVDQVSTTLVEESSSFFAGLMYSINPQLVHELIIIDDALGCYINPPTSSHGILDYVICLSLIPPVKGDSIGYIPIGNQNIFWERDTITNAPSFALTNVIPLTPMNGSTYTFIDSLGYYHNQIISDLLANDPDGSSFKTMTIQQICTIVGQKIEHDFYLPMNTLSSSTFINSLCNDINTIRNLQKTSLTESSCIAAIKAAYPSTDNVLDYIRNMAYVQKSPTVLSQAFQNVSSSTVLSPIEKIYLKTALIVEFASDRLWK